MPDGVMPERYYLHAADVVTGQAKYEVQMPVNGILYGMQWDLDQGRLVALHTEMDTGRINPNTQWRCGVLKEGVYKKHAGTSWRGSK